MFCHRQKQLEQSESRLSTQRGELSAVRETHQKGEVERQVLEGERAQLSEALARVRKIKQKPQNTHFNAHFTPGDSIIMCHWCDARCSPRLRAGMRNSLCWSISCSLRKQLSGTLSQKWEA